MAIMSQEAKITQTMPIFLFMSNKQFQPISETFVRVYYVQVLKILKRLLKELLGCRLWQLNKIVVLFSCSSIRKTHPHTDKLLEKVK